MSSPIVVFHVQDNNIMLALAFIAHEMGSKILGNRKLEKKWPTEYTQIRFTAQYLYITEYKLLEN